MAGKKSGKSSGKKKKGSGKKKGKKSAKSAKSAKVEPREVDILSPAAMENLYYIAHGTTDALGLRGFGWSDGPKKKGGKKGKGKKKK